MSGVIRINLHNVPGHLESGAVIECTIDGIAHDATFLEYGQCDGEIWKRLIRVQIPGWQETQKGKLMRDMFGTFCAEFVVNDAPGCAWHRGAGMVVKV